MHTRDEIRLGIGVLLLVEFITMLAAVMLLSRMTPAIEQILEQNERSIHAVERMLLVLSEPPPTELEPALNRQQRFFGALADARENITEPSEAPVMDGLDAGAAKALAGDPDALAEVRSLLRQLASINRDSMQAANHRAQRLGIAGAWTLVFLGMVGVGLSLAVLRRFERTLVAPIDDLGAVLLACEGGERYRRFTPTGAAAEFLGVAEVVNRLVEEHFGQRERDWEKVAQLDRLVLLHLLDARPEPTCVCDAAGRVVASNTAALELLGEAEGRRIRSDLESACGGQSVAGIVLEPVGGAWLCRLGGYGNP